MKIIEYFEERIRDLEQRIRPHETTPGFRAYLGTPGTEPDPTHYMLAALYRARDDYEATAGLPLKGPA